MSFLKGFLLMAIAFICLTLVSCGGKGVETGNPKPSPDIMSETYELASPKGELLYKLIINDDESAVVVAMDEEGNEKESVSGTLNVNDEDRTFSIEVIFSDGTRVAIYGEISEDGKVLNLRVEVNGVTISVVVNIEADQDDEASTSNPIPSGDTGESDKDLDENEEGGDGEGFTSDEVEAGMDPPFAPDAKLPEYYVPGHDF